MDVNELIGLISRWLHIIPAIILVGGTLFLRFSLVPACDESNASTDLRESIRKRWARLVMISVLLLLISGLYNAAMKAMGFELSMTYNILLLLKIILAIAIFYLASVLSGRSAMAQRFRQREKYWLNILCLLMLAVVLVAGFMKTDSANFDKKIRSETSANQIQTAKILFADMASLNSPDHSSPLFPCWSDDAR